MDAAECWESVDCRAGRRLLIVGRSTEGNTAAVTVQVLDSKMEDDGTVTLTVKVRGSSLDYFLASDDIDVPLGPVA